MDDTQTLKEVSLFASMNDEEIKGVRGTMQDNQFAPGQTIFHQKEQSGVIHVIMQGTVEYILTDSGGQELLLDTATTGEFFGELSMLSGQPVMFGVRAKDAVRTLAVHRDPFRDFMLKHPHAGTEVIAALSLRLYRTESVSRNANDVMRVHQTFGQWLADAFATNMGSWFFIIAQSLFLVFWVLWNTLAPGWRWDVYPFIFMNLGLSLQAAYAAPIIMMSQNRSSNKDRISAEIDHRVNVKAEIKTGMIMARLDDLEKSMQTLRRA